MKLFERNKAGVNQDELAERIAAGIIRRQQKIAAYLNEKCSRLSATGLKILLISIGCIFGSYCLYLVLTAITQ